MPVAVSLILIVLLALAAVGLYFARIIVFPNVSTIAESYQRQVEEGKLDETAFAALSKRELQIKSPFGYNLHAIYFPNGDTHKTVIIAHGISDTLYGSVKYMDLYLKRGFNVLLYDHRNHGQSGKCSTTYGLYEKQDLKAIVDWIFENTGQETLLGTMGESLGAAVVLQHCAVDERVSFVYK